MINIKFKPVIKWTGTKRKQSEKIVNLFPNKIENYYEPFCGSCSVLYQLLHSNIEVKNYIASDKNKVLIQIWNLIKNNPDFLLEEYKKHHSNLKKIGQDYYYEIRKEFNNKQKAIDFYFLTRTSINGLIRFNKKGEFNAPFHLTRLGIKPKNLKPILFSWHKKLKRFDVNFKHIEFEKVKPTKNDFLYLDPPYKNYSGMYYYNFNFKLFWSWLKNLKCKYALSFNGKSGSENNIISIDKLLYERHFFIESGYSSFKKMVNNIKAAVKDSLYLNY